MTEKNHFWFRNQFFVHSPVWKKNTKQFKFVSLVHFWKANFTEVQSDIRSAWTDLNPELELYKGLFSYLAHATSQWNKRHLILPLIITSLSFLQFNLPCSVGVPLIKETCFLLRNIWHFSRIFFWQSQVILMHQLTPLREKLTLFGCAQVGRGK